MEKNKNNNSSNSQVFGKNTASKVKERLFILKTN